MSGDGNRVLLGASEVLDAFTSPLDLLDVDLGDGVTIRVRGLTKRQQMVIQKIDAETELERFQMELFRMGVATNDEPLTMEQVELIVDTWPAGAFDKVLTGIMEVSGLGTDFRPGDED